MPGRWFNLCYCCNLASLRSALRRVLAPCGGGADAELQLADLPFCASRKAGWDELVSTEDLAIGRGDILIVEDMQPLGP